MNEPPKLTFLGRLAVVLIVAGCVYGAWHLWSRRTVPAGGAGAAGASSPGSGSPDPAGTVEVGIAYGTEKERWLQGAAEEFAKTGEGRKYRIHLIPMGSLEGAQAVAAGDTRIAVWSPASSLYEETFVLEWQTKQTGKPFTRKENLALTPMVFVFWKERYEAFAARYGEASFKTLGAALAEPSGWQTIAGKPEWGLFKLGHTHPNQSNSGLMTLALLAYEAAGKTRGLTLSDVLAPGFVTSSTAFERAVTGLANSTGNLMREMVLKGPSAFDAVVVYENVAIDYLKNAEGRWGQLRIVYPARNLWSENPYYVLNAPWVSAAQKEGAERFLDFLLTEPVQRQALVHGLRPGNPAVPVRFAGSPFVTYEPFGLRLDPGTICEPPPAEVQNNLLAAWQRTRGAS